MLSFNGTNNSTRNKNPLTSFLYPNTATNVAGALSPLKTKTLDNQIINTTQELMADYNASPHTSIDNGTPISEQQALAWDALKTQENLANKYIGLKKEQLDLNRDMGIASGFFQGLGSTVKAGLGIWGAIESAKNAKKSRELMDKKIANYNEQIEASREARQQRRDELARLSKMRSNTKAQFNTQASVTRSY